MSNFTILKNLAKIYKEQDLSLNNREAVYQAYRAYDNVKHAEYLEMDQYYEKLQTKDF